MAESYKIKDEEGLYFMTITTVGWVDLFIRNRYKYVIIDAWQYFMDKKGLNAHAYVIMSSHLHAIVSSEPTFKLVDTIRASKNSTQNN